MKATIADHVRIHSLFLKKTTHFYSGGRKEKMCKLIPRELTDIQKLLRYESCPSLFLHIIYHSFLNHFITYDDRQILDNPLQMFVLKEWNFLQGKYSILFLLGKILFFTWERLIDWF